MSFLKFFVKIILCKNWQVRGGLLFEIGAIDSHLVIALSTQNDWRTSLSISRPLFLESATRV